MFQSPKMFLLHMIVLVCSKRLKYCPHIFITLILYAISCDCLKKIRRSNSFPCSCKCYLTTLSLTYNVDFGWKCMRHWWTDNGEGKQEVPREKNPATLSRYPPWTSHGLAWYRTWSSLLFICSCNASLSVSYKDMYHVSCLCWYLCYGMVYYWRRIPSFRRGILPQSSSTRSYCVTS